MATSSREASPLSSLSSGSFEADEEHERLAAEARMPPAKRQRIGDPSSRENLAAHPADDDTFTAISSDTDGEVPSSPSNVKPDEEDTHEQVTICVWEGCDAGDLGNMDRLVDHIHNEHIETRQKKYTCEWSDCSRKSMPHASGYALKAHMRSHTREKPFYCALPECDRAFTRSDALAKHMRTVHETEALRPSDPIPKTMLSSMQSQTSKLTSKLKLVVKAPQSRADGINLGATNGATNGHDPSGWVSSFPAELGFTEEEESRGSKEMFRLLRRQVHWAEEEAESLKRSVEMLEELRRKEWIEKEILLDQAINGDISWHERRREVLAGVADLPTSEAIKAAADKHWQASFTSPKPGVAIAESPVPEKDPVDQREVAEVLASLRSGVETST